MQIMHYSSKSCFKVNTHAQLPILFLGGITIRLLSIIRQVISITKIIVLTNHVIKWRKNNHVVLASIALCGDVCIV